MVLSDTYSRVIKLPKLEFVNSESFIFLTASLKVKVTFAVIGIPVAVSAGSKVTTGAVESAAVKVMELAVIALSDSSSTVAPIATYTTCSLEKLLSGVIVINFLSVLMTASKSILEPLSLFSFKVIRLSTLASVIVESSICRIDSSKAIVISEFTAIPVAESAGVKVRVGGVESAAVKVMLVAVIALSEESSTVAPIAT